MKANRMKARMEVIKQEDWKELNLRKYCFCFILMLNWHIKDWRSIPKPCNKNLIKNYVNEYNNLD